jgi:hypothetical protein
MLKFCVQLVLTHCIYICVSTWHLMFSCIYYLCMRSVSCWHTDLLLSHGGCDCLISEQFFCSSYYSHNYNYLVILYCVCYSLSSLSFACFYLAGEIWRKNKIWIWVNIIHYNRWCIISHLFYSSLLVVKYVTLRQIG